MTYEQFIQMKSKEEIAFIFSQAGFYKKPCYECNFYEPDEYGSWKCRSLFEDMCREEFEEFLNWEMEGACGSTW